MIQWTEGGRLGGQLSQNLSLYDGLAPQSYE